MNSYDPRLDKLQFDVTELQSGLNEVRTGLDDVRTGLDDVRTDVSNLRGEMNARFSAIDRRFDAMERRSDERFNNLQILIESMQSDIRLTLEHLAPALITIAEHRGRLMEHRELLGGLDTRVTALEARRRRPHA